MTMDSETRKRLDAKWYPSPEHRFWLFDPEGDGMTYYRTEEARDEAAALAIQTYLDGEWAEEVESVAAGEVTHYAGKVDVETRPDDLDEEGCDRGGTYWGPDVGMMYNYALVPMTPKTKVTRPLSAVAPATTCQKDAR
jgi:hypothetical protein